MPEEIRDQFIARYAEGNVPWDDTAPPPEVIAAAAELPPGRALDLGCGHGRTAIHLAGHGWHADGVDFVPQAIAEAERRAQAAGVAARTRFYAHSVTDLSFLTPAYDLVVDVGCMHALSHPDMRSYLRQIHHLLRPGGLFLLFIRLGSEDDDSADSPSSLPLPQLRTFVEAFFTISKMELGETDMGDNSWSSGWFWLRPH